MSNLYSSHGEGGPPAPISSLSCRSTSYKSIAENLESSDNDVGETTGKSTGTADTTSNDNKTSVQNVQEEAPARERPPPGQDWPYRVSDIIEIHTYGIYIYTYILYIFHNFNNIKYVNDLTDSVIYYYYYCCAII